MVLNTSQEELIKQLEIADPKNFSRVGLPLVTRSLLRHVAEKNYLNATQVNEMYETILDASWGESEIGQERHKKCSYCTREKVCLHHVLR